MTAKCVFVQKDEMQMKSLTIPPFTPDWIWPHGENDLHEAAKQSEISKLSFLLKIIENTFDSALKINKLKDIPEPLLKDIVGFDTG